LSLRDKLKALEELQQIDLDAGALSAEAEQIPRRRAQIDAALATARKAYEAEKAKLDGNEREKRGTEQLLTMERDKVKKWEGRLGEIKTPREYAALSREIDIAKKTNETQNENLRALAAQAEEIKKALDAAADALSEREMGAEAELEELASREAEFGKKLGELAGRRADAAKRVDPQLLARYENIKKRRAGIAVSPVTGQTCGGCNRNIPPQLFIVLQRAESNETCPNCNRIIYSAQAVNPSLPSPA
jgi:predicted  nucleic acid-binding Zn-ribbon protein